MRALAGCPLSHGCRRASVSAAASGDAAQWAAPITDRRGSGDRPLGNVPPGRSGPEGRAKSRLPLWGALVPSGHRSALDRAGRRECPPKEGGEGQPQVAPGLERGKGSSIEKSQVLCGFQNLTQGSRVPHSCPCFPALLTLGASLKTQVLCGFWPLLTLWNIQVDPMPARGGFPPLSLLQLMGKCF